MIWPGWCWPKTARTSGALPIPKVFWHGGGLALLSGGIADLRGPLVLSAPRGQFVGVVACGLAETQRRSRVVGWQHLFVKVLPEGKGAMRQYFDKRMLLCRYSHDLFLARGPGRAWALNTETQMECGLAESVPGADAPALVLLPALVAALLWSADRLFSLQLPGDDLVGVMTSASSRCISLAFDTPGGLREFRFLDVTHDE
jgi:hypothetical protein